MPRFGINPLFIALFAASPPGDLSRARALVDELRYEGAIKLLDRVLQDPDGTAKERIEAYRLLGIAYAATGAPEAAEAAFSALLEIEPSYVLDPLLSPKIRSAFDRAKEKVMPLVRIFEVVATPIAARVNVTGRVDDPGRRLRSIQLFSRFSDRSYEAIEMTRVDDRIEGGLLLPILDSIRVEYYVVGRDGSGAEVARFGSPESPSSVVLERPPEIAPPPVTPPEEDTPWYGEWWVWTLVIGAVGIGVAATIVAVEMSDGSAPPGTLDPIRLE